MGFIPQKQKKLKKIVQSTDRKTSVSQKHKKGNARLTI